jgi:hypothetical protein
MKAAGGGLLDWQGPTELPGQLAELHAGTGAGRNETKRGPHTAPALPKVACR